MPFGGFLAPPSKDTYLTRILHHLFKGYTIIIYIYSKISIIISLMLTYCIPNVLKSQLFNIPFLEEIMLIFQDFLYFYLFYLKALSTVLLVLSTFA